MPGLNYIADTDTGVLAIFWRPNQEAVGFEIHENLILRMDLDAQQVVGLTILNFSNFLSNQSLRLLQIQHWIPEYRHRLSRLLCEKPLNQIFEVSQQAPNLSWIKIRLTATFQALIRELS